MNICYYGRMRVDGIRKDNLAMNNFLKKKAWWDSLHTDLQELLMESFFLIDALQSPGKLATSQARLAFRDYAFVVFPAAKAYEGFLKTLFLDLGFISKEDFFGKRLRIGKILNPFLETRIREKEGVYDKIVEYCGGSRLADTLWDTWKTCRNLLFHWFPNEKNAVDFNEAKMLVEKIINTIDLAFKECKIDRVEQ
ncbi:hypothetical protein A2892_05225 [Candidatus Woesebacteria bacterium RIFCSPLOWO2_01_FULL_39_10b]|uniref:Bacterial toxin RNase RnlA/LsoA DBD domain-containing protein n=1 Tax=Candidatus Woesebacteria bacterium RIFCSPLOWO2_01_FULL_39_10b TaxID=1802517 RepID=A0A1F8B7C5_9BACT|nr:MAG: hypothetical protein A2892_05225 [Candidatus Woesebacteria bacterium RIFCSPLOWO2_01_FULL_39_10b]